MKQDSNLDFDGMSGTGVNRDGNCYAGNQHGGKAGGNYGMGPRKGNASSSTGMKGSATGDAKKHTIATASQSKNADAGGLTLGAAKFSNPDKINVGR